MNAASFVVLGVLVLLFVLAVRYSMTHGSCEACSGSCGHGKCGNRNEGTGRHVCAAGGCASCADYTFLMRGIEESMFMVRNVIKLDGMACGMCEAHVCDALRKCFPEAKKVSASHARHEASFLTEAPADAEKVKAAINETGYSFVSLRSEEYEKKKLFGLF